ncbi:unnamed protein product [Sympodiomycopsis kandeliae]
MFARNTFNLLRNTSIAKTATTLPPPTLRNFTTTRANMVKILAILYDGGKAAQEEPRLYGTTENVIGIRDWAQQNGHELVVTSDKEGPGSEFQKHIKDADILITTPFHPGYATAEILKTAKNLKLAVTAGVGSDHIDLNQANVQKITVAEVSGSNVVSVAEHVIMTMLILVRNYNVGHAQAVGGTWQVSQIARDAFDLENKVIGTIGAGRIGYRVLERLVPFNPKQLLYYDYNELPAEAAKKVGVERVTDLNDFLSRCDVVTVNCPLHEGTINLINKDNIKHMKKESWLINTARGAICNAEAVAEAVNSGKILGYGGDVWAKQPAPKDHPWRSMEGPNGRGNAMVPHYSGTTLDAQARYAKGAVDIIQRHLAGKPQEPGNLIVENGDYATKAYGQRK